MKKYTVLYNPLSNNNNGESTAKKLKEILKEEILDFVDATKIKEFNDFVFNNENDIILCGGDGTLNFFVNNVDCDNLEKDIYYYATGSGNDFALDVKDKHDIKKPFKINEYIKKLPTAIVNNKFYKFINDVGFGIDGYACYAGEKFREKHPDKLVNYTKIVVEGFFKYYKTCDSRVTVDGKTYDYKRIWINPTMNSKYYGGGMKLAPKQDRLNAQRFVSVVCYHCLSKLKTAIVFPSVFWGGHIHHKEMVETHLAHKVKVEFSKPTHLQIDGEYLGEVTSYEVFTA